MERVPCTHESQITKRKKAAHTLLPKRTIYLAVCAFALEEKKPNQNQNNKHMTRPRHNFHTSQRQTVR